MPSDSFKKDGHQRQQVGGGESTTSGGGEQASTNSGGNQSNGLVKRIRTISTRLTAAAAEPKIKQNVVNFIHKSKSLTDAAFNKLNSGSKATGSKVNKNL